MQRILITLKNLIASLFCLSLFACSFYYRTMFAVNKTIR